MKIKATGIVRRIDDLGRIVIVKDVRRLLGYQDGDALEEAVAELDDGRKGVFLWKYRPDPCNLTDAQCGAISKALKAVLPATCNYALFDSEERLLFSTRGFNRPAFLSEMFHEVSVEPRMSARTAADTAYHAIPCGDNIVPQLVLFISCQEADWQEIKRIVRPQMDMLASLLFE